MATKIILKVDDGLTEQEQTDLRYLLPDALGEFASRRTPEVDYVHGRYPDLNTGPLEDKIRQVMRRNLLAKKLHNAALTFRVVIEGPGLDVETVEEMAESGERAKASVLLLQDLFGMEEEEARATFNQLEDKRISKLMNAKGLVTS